MALLVFEHSASAGSLRLGATLRDYGHPLVTIRTHAGDDVPADLDGVDGIVSMGAALSLDDPLPWLEAEMDLIREAHERELPVVGICLGCQIVARALGGTTGPMDDGIELGFVPFELNAIGRDDPMFTGMPWTTHQFAWHCDEVKDLPAGARLLASSPQCNVQAWASGLRTYGFQYHPEVYPHTIEEWIERHPDDLADADLTPEDLRDQMARHGDDFARYAVRLFESIALFLMPVDRRYQGQIKDLHH
ncbi:MAG: type 1 glutamine amidotransferase [Planctomycetota bacterium]